MEKVKKQYVYNGPVRSFENCLSSHWKGSTFAASEKKARSNLAHQYKKEHGMSAYARVELTGKIIEIP